MSTAPSTWTEQKQSLVAEMEALFKKYPKAHFTVVASSDLDIGSSVIFSSDYSKATPVKVDAQDSKSLLSQEQGK